MLKFNLIFVLFVYSNYIFSQDNLTNCLRIRGVSINQNQLQWCLMSTGYNFQEESLKDCHISNDNTVISCPFGDYKINKTISDLDRNEVKRSDTLKINKSDSTGIKTQQN